MKEQNLIQKEKEIVLMRESDGRIKRDVDNNWKN